MYRLCTLKQISNIFLCLANGFIDVAILWALFRSAKAKAEAGDGNPRASLLHLALIWDRFDIAKAQILSDVILDSDAAVGDSATNPVCPFPMHILKQSY